MAPGKGLLEPHVFVQTSLPIEPDLPLVERPMTAIYQFSDVRLNCWTRNQYPKRIDAKVNTAFIELGMGHESDFTLPRFELGDSRSRQDSVDG